jgi:GNAT superfamily N-acetyltransferase
MLTQRKIDIEKDRKQLLEFHCQINYESESPWARAISYEKYRTAWMKTSQPQVYLDNLMKTRIDNRTIAEIWEENGTAVGYIWVVFTDVDDYNFKFAEIQDITVISEYRKKGIATLMLEHIEEIARKKGAAILRSGTGIENHISQKLHSDSGFQVYRVEFEKVLKNPLDTLTKVQD